MTSKEKEARIARIAESKLSPKQRLAKLAHIRHGRTEDEFFVELNGRIIGSLIRETISYGFHGSDRASWKGYGMSDCYISLGRTRYACVANLITKYSASTHGDANFNEWITAVKTRLELS